MNFISIVEFTPLIFSSMFLSCAEIFASATFAKKYQVNSAKLLLCYLNELNKIHNGVNKTSLAKHHQFHQDSRAVGGITTSPLVHPSYLQWDVDCSERGMSSSPASQQACTVLLALRSSKVQSLRSVSVPIQNPALVNRISYQT